MINDQAKINKSRNAGHKEYKGPGHNVKYKQTNKKKTKDLGFAQGRRRNERERIFYVTISREIRYYQLINAVRGERTETHVIKSTLKVLELPDPVQIQALALTRAEMGNQLPNCWESLFLLP